MNKIISFFTPHQIKVVMIILFFAGCSTQKDTAINRLYHQLNTKYNGLFYAEKYLNEGIAKVKATHKDNYENIIRINKYSDINGAKSAQISLDNAIEKSTLAIQHHSMEIEGEEKNKLIDKNYMVIAMSEFYKHDYTSSIKTFNFLVRKSTNENIKTESLIWATKCHQELKNKESLRKNIRTLEEEYDLSQEQNALLSEIRAENAIQEGYYLEAKDYLNKAAIDTKDKETKTRIYYILGQINLILNEPEDALNNFNEVVKKNPEYEMVFNAKLMRTQAYVEGRSTFLELSTSLDKMIKDRKNIEYKDQIYFSLAALQLKKLDTLSAINSLQLATKNHVNNNSQKLASHYLLASLFWERQDYIDSYNHCDTAYQLVDRDSPDYESIKKMLKSSKKIASKYNLINYNDSIISLAQLPSEDRNQLIDNYIQELKEQDLKEKASPDRSGGGSFNSYEYNRQAQNSMSISSGGGWYFYNPSAMSLGYSEFLSRWGNRKLEDNWRRKNKNEGFSEGGSEEEGLASVPTDKEKYSRDYYLEQLPLEDEEQLILLSKIEAAYYDLGSLFKEEVEDYPQSISVYNEMTQRFPSTNYMPLIYFDLYSVYTLQGDSLKAQKYLEKIKKEYPESDYLSILNGNNVEDTKLSQDKKSYKLAHDLYTEFSTESCQRLQNLLKTDSENTFIPQIELLNAFCEAKKSNKTAFIESLKNIKTRHPKSQISGKVDTIILVLNGELGLKENDIYENNLKSTHYFLLIIENLNINLPEMQSSISKFNNLTHKLDSLETTNLLLTKSLQLLRVGEFNNSENATAYYELIKEHNTTKSLLKNKDIQPLIISKENYTQLLRRKNINEYFQYFNEIYLLN